MNIKINLKPQEALASFEYMQNLAGLKVIQTGKDKPSLETEKRAKSFSRKVFKGIKDQRFPERTMTELGTIAEKFWVDEASLNKMLKVLIQQKKYTDENFRTFVLSMRHFGRPIDNLFSELLIEEWSQGSQKIDKKKILEELEKKLGYEFADAFATNYIYATSDKEEQTKRLLEIFDFVPTGFVSVKDAVEYIQDAIKSHNSELRNKIISTFSEYPKGTLKDLQRELNSLKNLPNAPYLMEVCLRYNESDIQTILENNSFFKGNLEEQKVWIEALAVVGKTELAREIQNRMRFTSQDEE